MRLLEAERGQRTLAQGLQETAIALNASLDPEEILDSILENIARVVSGDVILLRLFEGDQARLARHRILNPDLLRDWAPPEVITPSEQPMLDFLHRQQRPVLYNDGQSNVDGITAKLTWIRSYVDAPVVIDGTTIGYIGALSHSAGYYTPEDMERVQVFADQAAVAIRNARLYESTRRNAQQLDTLRQMMLDISGEYDLDTLFALLLEKVQQVMQVKTVGVYLYVPERHTLRWSYSVGSSQVVPVGFEVVNGQGLGGHIWQLGRAFALDSYWEWEGRLPEVAENPDWDTTAGVPISWGGRFLGVLTAAAKRIERSFSREDLHFLSLLADQAAIAIWNARLLQSARSAAERLDTLRQITLDMTSQSAVDSLIPLMLERIVQSMRVENAGMHLYDPERDVLRWSYAVGEGTSPIGQELRRGERLGGRIWSTGQAMLFENFWDWVGEPHPPGVRWDMAAGVPVMWGREFLGVMLVGARSQERRLTESDIRYLRMLADQLAVALANLRLYESVKKNVLRSEGLREIERGILEAKTSEESSQAALRHSHALVPFDLGAVYFFDHTLTKGILLALEGNMGNEEPRREITLAEMNSLPTLQEGRTVLVKDMREIAQPISLTRSMLAAGLRSLLIIPLMAEKNLGGILVLAANKADAFAQEHIEVANEVSTALALALQQSRLREELQRYTTSLEARVADRTRELTEANQRLQALGQMKDEFVANVSHELRTPLTSLKLYQRLLREQPDRQTAYLATLERETNRLQVIVEDLLGLSEVDRLARLEDMKPMDINRLIEEYVADRATLAVGTGLDLLLDLEDGLPHPPGEIHLMARVLDVLVSNAISYTPAGGQVEIATRRDMLDGRPAVTFCVSDTGAGLTEAEQGHLFERFFRGRAGRESGRPGTGLGLAIAHQIVSLHNGKISAYSAGIAKGAVFTVWLPLLPGPPGLP